MQKLFFGNVTPYYDDTMFECSYKTIGAYRKNKIDSLKTKEDKVRSLTAGLLFEEACKAFGLELLIDKVKDDSNGKPFFDCADEMFPGGKRMYFNISHSGDYVLVGMSDGPIGVDIQQIKDIKSDVASRSFTQEEQDLYYKASDEEYQTLFFKLWCLKESYSKFKGTGLKEGFNTFSVLNHMQDCGLWHDEYVYAVTTSDYRQMDAKRQSEDNAETETMFTEKVNLEKANSEKANAEKANAVKANTEKANTENANAVTLDNAEKALTAENEKSTADIISRVPDKLYHICDVFDREYRSSELISKRSRAVVKREYRMVFNAVK